MSASSPKSAEPNFKGLVNRDPPDDLCFHGVQGDASTQGGSTRMDIKGILGQGSPLPLEPSFTNLKKGKLPMTMDVNNELVGCTKYG